MVYGLFHARKLTHEELLCIWLECVRLNWWLVIEANNQQHGWCAHFTLARTNVCMRVCFPMFGPFFTDIHCKQPVGSRHGIPSRHYCIVCRCVVWLNSWSGCATPFCKHTIYAPPLSTSIPYILYSTLNPPWVCVCLCCFCIHAIIMLCPDIYYSFSLCRYEGGGYEKST